MITFPALAGAFFPVADVIIQQVGKKILVAGRRRAPS